MKLEPKYKIISSTIMVIIISLTSCQTRKLAGEYSGEYKDLSRYTSGQISNEPPKKKYKTITDSNGVIIDREEDKSSICNGGGHDLYEQMTTPYMTQTVRIYKKKGINLNVSFQLNFSPYKAINYFGTGNLSGDTLVVKLKKDRNHLVMGDTLFGQPFTVRYLVKYDYYDEENYLYYIPELNGKNVELDSLWKEEKSLRIDNADTM